MSFVRTPPRKSSVRPQNVASSEFFTLGDDPVVDLPLGASLFNAHRQGEGSKFFNRDFPTMFFTLREQDLLPEYGNRVDTYTATQSLHILNVDKNQHKSHALVLEKLRARPDLQRMYQDNWVRGRHTERETDYKVLDFLANALTGYDGVGTSQGDANIDSRNGHHAEVALFYNARVNKLALANTHRFAKENTPPPNVRKQGVKKKRRRNLNPPSSQLRF